MNRKHFQLVLDQITQHPDTWDQRGWHCKTTHCLAGWAQILAGQPANEATVRRDARIYLDISSTEADWLFRGSAILQNFLDFLNAVVVYNQDGYDAHGYDAHGYDRDGYDRDGYDRDGLDRGNQPRPRKD